MTLSWGSADQFTQGFKAPLQSTHKHTHATSRGYDVRSTQIAMF